MTATSTVETTLAIVSESDDSTEIMTMMLPCSVCGCYSCTCHAGGQTVMVCPLVSRHFDFLDGLWSGKAGTLPLSQEVLHHALSHSTLLLGSAPVGPTTRWSAPSPTAARASRPPPPP